MSNVKKLKLEDPDFPDSLRNIPDPPKQIYALGDLKTMSAKKKLAIVGSRRITPYGKFVTSSLGQGVARKGIVIVSGLALGVDAVAHQAALDSGGLTIAVLASGLDTITPKTNHHLAQNILKSGGAIISEYPPGTPPIPSNFIARNRIVSGISDGVLITEAAAKSGTMHTANFALEQGKTVMAVPGNINSPFSEGTNNLIKSGAIPITNTSEILLGLGLTESAHDQTELFGSNLEEVLILKLLSQGTTDASELLKLSNLNAKSFNQTISMLEITGRIYSLGAGHWALK